MESLCAVKLKRSDKAFINAYADLLTNGCSDKIYVSDICKKAGYTTMCFYQNYEDKNAFGKFIVDYETDIYIDSIREFIMLMQQGLATPEKAKKCVSKFFNHVYDNQSIYTRIFNGLLMEDCDRYISDRVAKSTRDILKIDIDCKGKKKYLNWFLARRNMTAFCLAERWQKNGYDCTPDEMSETFYDICMLLDSGVNLTKTFLL